MCHPAVEKQPYHSHLLHLAHELDEDSVEDLADAGKVRVGPVRSRREYLHFSQKEKSNTFKITTLATIVLICLSFTESES